jgi:RNase adapter protein RapZ
MKNSECKVKKFNIIIITGRSGSGKSTAIHALEDAGFYCVDNMPVALLPMFLEQPIESVHETAGFAFVMDLREKGFLSKYSSIFNSLEQIGYTFEIIFLEADEGVLLRRYSQTRRHHPLSSGKGLIDGIRAEEKELESLRLTSDTVIDTSHCNVHELRSIILDIAKKSVKLSPMRIHVVSFGFKFGVPRDADLIVDVRFLANPFFVPELQALDGETEAVRNYVLKSDETRIFLKKYFDLIDYLLPLYEKEGKAYLTIAVGCTGGRHRSVVVARNIFEHIHALGKTVELMHRNVES